MKAVIIGAGRGNRLMPVTDDIPKCLAEVGLVSPSIQPPPELTVRIHQLRQTGKILQLQKTIR